MVDQTVVDRVLRELDYMTRWLMFNPAWWIARNWDVYCDWVEWEPPYRAFLVPEDVQ